MPSINSGTIKYGYSFILSGLHLHDHFLFFILGLLGVGVPINVLRVHLKLLEMGHKVLDVEGILFLTKSVVNSFDIIVGNYLRINFQFFYNALKSTVI